MGIFDIFKKGKKNVASSSDNGVLGPLFLDGNVDHIPKPKKLHSHEWRRKLKTKTNQTFFKIKYYGARHSQYKNLIVQTDFAPSQVIAVEPESGKEILLFDGCTHGYNAMFCDKYSEDQIKDRIMDEFYTDAEGNDVFELIISAYYGIDFEDEFRQEVDSNGQLELINGLKMDFEKVKRNAYDTLQIWAINGKGKKIEIVSEELA